LNATITVNGLVQPQRLAIAILASDILSGLRYGGTGLLFGGNGSLSIESIERKSISFWCDPAEQPYTLGYCLAPSMHMCKDFHYRPECKPPPDCSKHGSYDPMQHVCLCDNNYGGGNCEIEVCTPACVFGDCEENNTCSCWENIYGQRCEQYRTNNVTNNTAAGNMTIFSGAVIVVSYANNNTYLTVLGTVFIENGTTVVLVVDYVPRIGDRYTILVYGRRVGQFSRLHVAGMNGAPFPRCLNYTIEYGQHEASVVFIDGCAEQDLPVPWYATVGVLLAVFAVIVLFVLLARYNQRFRAFLLPFRRHLHRYYRIARPGVVINDSDGEGTEVTGERAPDTKKQYQSLTEITAKETRRDPLSPPGYTKVPGADIIEVPKDQHVYGKTEAALARKISPGISVSVSPAAVVTTSTEDVKIDIPFKSGTTTVTFVSTGEKKE
jgi:hypothetical protein